MWRVRLLDANDEPQQWVGEAEDGNDAEAKALAAFPGATIKSGTEI
jgi:hypothetical protein